MMNASNTPESDVNHSTDEIPNQGQQRPLTPRAQLAAVTVILLLLAGTWGFIFYITPEPRIITKESLKATIIKAIENGADLRAVKQVYVNREQFLGWGFFAVRPTTTHYPISIPLSVVLEDIRTDLFINPDADKSLIPRIDVLIVQHLQTNPFDKLEPTQKDHFERLREKIGARYTVVQTEVTKIADELYAQNLLTKQYLRDSTISFWVSIAGLALSLVIGTIQIYQGRGAPRAI